MKKILVVGGAGYIGSHMVKQLLAVNENVVTLDNLSTGHRDAVLGGEFVLADLCDQKLLDKIFVGNKFDTVMHFASFIQVSESVTRPDKYYENNLANTINLLNAMARHQVKNFIFSSSAAIFGEPKYTPIDEIHPQNPINPYGRSKWMVEQLLPDYDRAFGIRSVCLRYFNAAGADPDGKLGERHEPETHLIPLILDVAAGRLSALKLFGTDYDTPDGTCIRDYVHITDLCDAHLLAVNYLRNKGQSECFNLGSNSGYSVRQVIETAEKIVGKSIPLQIEKKREGDPACLVADSTKAKSLLGWSPKYTQLEAIIAHAWKWEVSRIIPLL